MVNNVSGFDQPNENFDENLQSSIEPVKTEDAIQPESVHHSAVQTVATSLGVVGGGLTGAMIGRLVGGRLGAAVGAVVGGVAGANVGREAAEGVDLAIEGVVDNVRQTVDEIKPSVIGTVDAVKHNIEAAQPSVTGVIDSVRETIDEARPSVTEAIDAVVETIDETRPSMVETVDAVKTTVEESRPAVSEAVHNTSASIQSSAASIADSVQGVAQSVKGAAQEAQPKMTEAMESVSDNVQSSAASVANSVQQSTRPRFTDENWGSVEEIMPATTPTVGTINDQANIESIQDSFDRGLALSSQGNLAGSEAAFKQVIRMMPDSPEAHFNLGVVIYQQGREMEGLDHIRQARDIARMQGNNEAADNLDQVLLQVGPIG